MARPAPYSYSDAGFNGFFRRTLTSSPLVSTLGSMPGAGSRQINFDQMQVSGSIGDTLRVGTIGLNGSDRNITIDNELGEVAGIIGDTSRLGDV